MTFYFQFTLFCMCLLEEILQTHPKMLLQPRFQQFDFIPICLHNRVPSIIQLICNDEILPLKPGGCVR
jgi:hypothetical protein